MKHLLILAILSMGCAHKYDFTLPDGTGVHDAKCTHIKAKCYRKASDDCEEGPYKILEDATETKECGWGKFKTQCTRIYIVYECLDV